MDLLSFIADNVSDVLLKVIRFAELRRDLLRHNVDDIDDDRFRPRDMPVLEFAAILDAAVAEHFRSGRLVFRDTDNLRFGPNGLMELRVTVDRRAEMLLRTNRTAYLKYQKNRRQENARNLKAAQELLEWTCGPCADAIRLQSGLAVPGVERMEASWSHSESGD